MAKNVMLLLSSNRGGTHLFGDFLLTSDKVSQLIEMGIFWQLYHKNNTVLDEVVSLTDPETLQNPGYNFQFEGPHRQAGRLLTYAELFQALCQKYGTQVVGSSTLEEANETFARGLDAIESPHAIIFNKLTFSTEFYIGDFHWTADDSIKSLDYLCQFFEKNPEYSLDLFAVIRNPYDVYLAMTDHRRYMVPPEDSLLVIRSFADILAYAMTLENKPKIFRYEDIANDPAAFISEIERDYGIATSSDFAVYNNAINKPHGEIPALAETVRDTIFAKYYDLQPVMRPSPIGRAKRYASLQTKILWYLIANKESSGGGGAMKSLDPALDRKSVV